MKDTLYNLPKLKPKILNLFSPAIENKENIESRGFKVVIFSIDTVD